MVPPKVSQSKMDLLLWCLHHPEYKKESLSTGVSKTRRLRVQRLLPVQVPINSPSTHPRTVRVPTGDCAQAAGKKIITKSVHVQYNSIHETLVRQLSSPPARRYWLWVPTDRGDDDPILEFVDTPLAKQPRRWARDGTASFNLGDVEYRVVDCVLLPDHPDFVYRVLQTTFVVNKKFLDKLPAWPTLEMDLQEFKKCGGREIMQVQTTFEHIPVTDIASKCTVTNAEALPGDFWCNRHVDNDGTETPLIISHASLSFDDFGVDALSFALFIDGFEDENGSTDALYISYHNVKAIVRGMDMFKFKVMLVPPGVDTHEACELLQRDNPTRMHCHFESWVASSLRVRTHSSTHAQANRRVH